MLRCFLTPVDMEAIELPDEPLQDMFLKTTTPVLDSKGIMVELSMIANQPLAKFKWKKKGPKAAVAQKNLM